MGSYNDRYFSNLRDCVKKCLEKGAKSRWEFNGMRYGIICDLKRVGYKEDEIVDILKDWNQKNYRVLSCKDFISDVADYVTWVFKKDCNAGCNYFKKKDCCFSDCEFIKREKQNSNVNLEQEVVYAHSDIEKHLKEYEQCENAIECAYVYKIIDAKRVKLGLTRDKIIFMYFEEMKNALWESGVYTAPSKMFASRCVIKLINSGLLEIAKRGKVGCFDRHAHGYKLKTPEDVMKDDLFNYRDN